MGKPLIGIFSTRASRSETGEVLPAYKTSGDYIEQTVRAGGVPVQLPLAVGLGEAALDAWLAAVDGVLLPGGGDLDPAFYGTAPLPGVETYARLTSFDRRCQTLELELIRRAAAADKPILGICLGVQAINTAFGGTLVQDIPSEVPGALTHAQQPDARSEVTHRVALCAGTLLARLSGLPDGGELEVNTYHHQAVAQPAAGFVVAARAPDGVIEAIEDAPRRILGVQWHPENLAAQRGEAFALLRWLVDESARGGGR
jgi:putative glutamine amidotransferase